MKLILGSYCGWTKSISHRLRDGTMGFFLRKPANIMVSTMASFRGAKIRPSTVGTWVIGTSDFFGPLVQLNLPNLPESCPPKGAFLGLSAPWLPAVGP